MKKTELRNIIREIIKEISEKPTDLDILRNKEIGSLIVTKKGNIKKISDTEYEIPGVVGKFSAEQLANMNLGLTEPHGFNIPFGNRNVTDYKSKK
tara:strand:+ start:83 stop:367 length:285 start_codon:yes stop_codon:yes gene_type:complete